MGAFDAFRFDGPHARIRTNVFRLLAAYFVCSSVLGSAYAVYKFQKIRAARAKAELHEVMTVPGLEFDSGVIGPIADVVHLDWSPGRDLVPQQTQLREKFRTVLGRPFPYTHDPVIEVRSKETLPNGLERQMVTIAAEAGFQIKACLLLPPGTARVPAVLISYGLGGSTYDTCGFGAKSYHNDAGAGLGLAGYASITYELRSLGRAALDWGRPEWGDMEYNDIVGYSLVRGSSAMSIWVNDGLQVLNALARHPRIDTARIVSAGVSHGGQIAMYIAALEPARVAGAISMGSFVSFNDLYTKIHNWTGHAIPGIAKVGDMADLGALVAPRPFMAQLGELDRGYREAEFHHSSVVEFTRLKAAYGAFGARENATLVISRGVPHVFDVQAAVAFLDATIRRR